MGWSEIRYDNVCWSETKEGAAKHKHKEQLQRIKVAAEDKNNLHIILFQITLIWS